MTDWTAARLGQRWSFRRVSRADFSEGPEVPQVTGGELSLSALDDLKVTGTLDFEGPDAPDGMMRVYYSFESGGETVELPLATLFASCASPTYDGKSASGMLECSSSLKPMAKRLARTPYSVPAGSGAVALAAALASECGLPVSATASAYRTPSETVFEAGTSYLEIANGMLRMAGYSSCSPDPYGTVVMAPYVEPADRAVAFSFADGEHSIMYPEVSPESELDVPNVFALSYESDSEGLWATAVNADASDPRSVANADEVTEFESVFELNGETRDDRLAALKALAASRLADAATTVEKVSLSHAWLPVWPGDAVEVAYSAAGISWRGTVSSMRVSLSGAMRCETGLRRFSRPKFEVTVEGGVLWDGD